MVLNGVRMTKQEINDLKELFSIRHDIVEKLNYFSEFAYNFPLLKGMTIDELVEHYSQRLAHFDKKINDELGGEDSLTTKLKNIIGETHETEKGMHTKDL